MRKLIEFSVRNSLFVNLLSVFLLAAGCFSMMTMQKEAFPNISYDIVTVQTNYFGAPPQEIEKLISIKLENELKEVDGIDEINTISTENVSMVVIQLDPDVKNKYKVVNDIQRAVDRTQDLPADLEDDPIVTEIESRNFPVINVSISGDLSESELQEHAKNIETRLLDLDGVAKIARVGWRDREIWVEVNPKYVDAYKLSLDDVIEALQNQNLNLPGGTLDTATEGEYLVRTIGEFETSEEIKKVIIRANDVGNWIRVEDVANVQDTFEDDDLLEKTRGTKAITLTVIKKESSDIIDVVQQTRDTVAEYMLTAPPALEASFFDDYSYYVKRRLNVLTTNGKIGILLVLLSLLMFLTRSVAITTALGIPVALATTFLIMNMLGLTINLITMFALIMILGLIVDDAIVIAENVYRYIEKGMDPREAAVVGASEVALPVLSTVLTSVAAFSPLFFMKGIMGKFISAMPIVVIIALTASLIEAYLVLPAHLADFCKRPNAKKRKKSLFARGFQNFRIGYLKLLRWVVHHRYKAFVLISILFISSFLLFKTGLKFVLFPQGLIEEFFIRTKAPIGTSLAENERRLQQIEAFVREIPEAELDNYITQVGLIREDASDPYTDRGSHVGQLHIFLTPEKSRSRTADQIIQILRDQTKSLGNLFDEISYEKVRAGPPVGKPVNIQIRGDSLERLELVAEQFKSALHKLKGVEDIKDDYDPGKTELRIIVGPEAAQKTFLTVRDIAHAIRNALDGNVATTIQKTDEEIDVIVRYPEEYRNSKDVIDKLYVANKFGNLVPLNKVAKTEERAGINVIKRLDRKRMIQVTATVDEDITTSLEVQKAMEHFFTGDTKAAFPDATISFGGEQEKTAESMTDFYRAFILALFLIFIILAANFNSVVQPLVVMFSIPFGITGVIFAFYLHGQPFSFMALLGLIGLSGVVVNDSIVLVDFINKHRKLGWSRARSIYGAGRVRLRPVLLTSISTVAGRFPRRNLPRW